MNELATDPTKPDSDGDGLFDGEEVGKLGTDPRTPDWDHPLSKERGAVKGPGEVEIDPRAPLPPDWTCEVKVSNDCFAKIPGGTFLMGAQASDPAGPGHDPDARPDEGPPHRVTLSGFHMQRGEVTASLYQRCVDAGACSRDDVLHGEGYATLGGEGLGDHPVNGVSWEGARKVCAWLGGRLPTEAEWEYAARGPDSRRFPWGDTPGCGVYDPDDAFAKTGSCLQESTQATGRLRGASPFGLLGMAGNVWEWTADAYAPDTYARGDVTDPTGPPAGTARVQRGGGWTSSDPLELRSAARASLPPDQRMPDVGVRCVRDR